MPKVKVSTIVSFYDNLLRTGEIQDYDGAVNGLQVANRNGTVSRIAATVDASLATARLAVNAGADLMLVHHGLFWSRSHPWVGKNLKAPNC
jgi:putative NIF3 family GTP cyclohydrolase 1 type 2